MEKYLRLACNIISMEAVCVHCGYKWQTEAKSFRLVCSRCGKTTKNPNFVQPVPIKVEPKPESVSVVLVEDGKKVLTNNPTETEFVMSMSKDLPLSLQKKEEYRMKAKKLGITTPFEILVAKASFEK
jgi:hypothetical protein